MAYNQQKIEQAQKLFAEALQIIKENAYCVPADKVPTADAIANLVGKEIRWNCQAAQDVAYEVLTEVNEHTLAERFHEVAADHNRTFDLEQV
tara:strand:+ start:348 stop:623 length:276 start_codon:yes stop_codon:yes gene_type:complete